jgi:serine/threonine protein phosphatase 1
MFFSKFRRREGQTRHGSSATPRVPAGVRAYAVGDVHGRLDLLDALLTKIRAEIVANPMAKNHLVMLGDLIDRGPQSCGVIDRLCGFADRDVELHVLSGNHEEVLLRLLEGESELIPSWLKYGGADTLQSYGIEAQAVQAVSEDAGMRLIRAAIPSEHQAFLRSLSDTIRIGDYLFVHAGIRPRVDLAEQRQSDLRWIREPFLGDQTDHGFIVVHGHTISEDAVERPNRIGIDTGAYATGRLTALGLEGAKRWLIEAAGAPG